MSAVHRTRPDVIAHLASAKPWQMDAGYVAHPDPLLGVDAIINGTANLLEIARELGVPRVVFASSKSAYAPFAGRHTAPTYDPVPETYPARPTEVYGITKLAAEQLGGYYRAHLGVDVIALRFGSTYGPFKRGAGVAPAGLIGSAIEGLLVRATYEETTYRLQIDEFVYNRDVGRGIQLACAVDATADWLFNIGTGEGSSIEDVVDAIADVPGVQAPEVTIVADGTPGAAKGHLVPAHAGVLDCSAARDQLGYVARFDLRAGIADAAEVFRASSTAVPA
jgi:nucleoside-diphosphate-sugar epimerase